MSVLTRYSLAILLAAAALAKLAGLGVETVGGGGWISEPAVQFALIEIELVLAAWIWSGRQPVGAWLVSLALFLVFANFSFFQILAGETSCGCFGAIRVKPWQALAIDGAALVLILAGMPRELTFPNRKNAVHFLKMSAVSAIVLAGVYGSTALAAWTIFGSYSGLKAYLSGETVIFTSRLIDLGEFPPGQIVEKPVEIRNAGAAPLLIFGGTSGCGCSVHKGLPLTIPPGEKATLTVAAGLNAPGTFTRIVEFYVSEEGVFRFQPFRITGKCIEAISVKSDPDEKELK